MKEEFVFRREEAFKEWLPKNNVVASVAYYVSNIKSIQENLKIDVDRLLDNGIERALERVTMQSIPRQKKVVSNFRSVLKKYWKFTQSKD